MSNKYNIKPQGARVLLVLHSVAEKVVGGVILPSAAQDESVRHASVVEWGSGCKSTWSVNDKVMIGKDAGLSVKKEDGFESVLINEDDILAVLEEENSIATGLREGRAFPVVAGDNYVAPIIKPTGESFILVKRYGSE